MNRIRAIFTALALATIASPDLAADAAKKHVVKLPELSAPAEIRRDSNNIAHIMSRNEHDLFLLQGYVHAQDRLFQMDVSRRTGSGTLAELLGPGALASDVPLRTLGVRRAAENSLRALSQRARRVLAAYAAGVNAYVANHPLPVEYGALEISRFEPWTALDSLVVLKLFVGVPDVSDIERTVTLATYRETGAAAGFDGETLFFADVFRVAPFEPVTTLGKALGQMSAAHSKPGSRVAPNDKKRWQRTTALAQDYMAKMAQAPWLQRRLDRERRRGSNEWVISGAHTTTGAPMLANDPHLALSEPAIFYPLHLHNVRTGFNVIGDGFTGVPLVAIGHNRRLAWGATINPLDLSDVYSEQIVPDPDSPSGFSSVYQGELEPVIALAEHYRVNQPGNGVFDDVVPAPPSDQVPAATLIVPRRNMGPIISLDAASGTALSVQSVTMSPTRELDALLAFNGARDLADFKKGLQFFDSSSFNFAYADVDGNIAYLTTGEIPVREDLQRGAVDGLPPFFIREGSGGNEWLAVQNPQPNQALPHEILPMSEMPRLVNPPAGWFANSNNDPVGNTLDNNVVNDPRPGGGIYYLNSGYAEGIRAARAVAMIENLLSSGDNKISFEEMQAMQADVALGDAQVFVPFITRALENARLPGAAPALAALAANPSLVAAVARLQDWDFTSPTGIKEGYDAADEGNQLAEPGETEIAASVATTLYSVWRGQFIGNTLDATLAPFNLPGPNSGVTLAALRHLLDNFDANLGFGASGLNFFVVQDVDDPYARRDILLLQSLVDALERLAGEAFAAAFDYSTDMNDYRWGKLHRVVFQHPLGDPFNVPPALGNFPSPLPGLPGIPTDGGLESIDFAAHDARADSAEDFMFSSGPVSRTVSRVTRGKKIAGRTVVHGGTSAVQSDPNYLDQLPLWLSNEYLPMRFKRRDIKRDTASITLFRP